jgi:hypothetical protein
MADNKLEPLSDPFKALLQSVNINPEQFNNRLNSRLLQKAIKGRFSTRANNQEYYDNVGRLDTIASVAERILKKPPKVYFPLGYVMYVRKAHCKSCGADHTCMDAPGLFLMQTDKLGGPTRVFIPVTAVEFPTLPHWTQEISVETPFCLDCYTLGTPVPAVDEIQSILSPSTPTVGVEQPAPAAAAPCES